MSSLWRVDSQLWPAFISMHTAAMRHLPGVRMKQTYGGLAFWAENKLKDRRRVCQPKINGLRSPEIDDAKGLIILRFESLNVLNVYQVSGAAFHPTISTVTPPQDGPLCKSPHAKFT